MTASTTGSAPAPDRPLGLSILAVLAVIPFVAWILVLLLGKGGIEVVSFALTLLGLITAYGLWNLRPWAWPLALVIWSLATIDAVLLLAGHVFNSNLIVGPIVVFYLLQSSIRSLFRQGG